MHTPSTPTVSQPASATDPRYSTSGILNAQLKEKNRQGLMSTHGGRSGHMMNINKFADQKISMRDPSAISALENLSRMYSDVSEKSKLRGVDNADTSTKKTAKKNIAEYNQSVDSINNYLKSYGISETGAEKAGRAHNFDKRTLHDNNYGATNKDSVKSSVSNLGSSGEAFNQLEEKVKKQKQPTKQ